MSSPRTTEKKHMKPSLLCKVILCFIFIVIPLIVMIAGFLTINGHYPREDNLKGYNNALIEWPTQMKTFENLNFAVNNETMKENKEKSGAYWPIRDDCNKHGDPETGCTDVDALSYKLVQNINSDHFTITANNKVIYEITTPISVVHDYTKAQMNCDDIDDCREKCLAKKGTFRIQDFSCHYTLYLSDICIRVNSNNTLILDTPASQTFLAGQNIGCYKASNYNPAYYVYTPVTSITVEVRNAYDPFISADYYTDSCNLINSNSNSCLGVSKYSQTYVSHILVIVSSVILVIEIIVIIVLVLVCRKHNKEDKQLLSHSATSTPITVQSPNAYHIPTTSFPSIFLAPGDSYVSTTSTGPLDTVSRID